MKRILIFSLNYYPRFIGGAEVAIKEITDRVPREEIEFHMVTLRFDSNLAKTERVGNVLVHRIGPVRKDPGISDLRRFPLHFNKHLYQFIAAFEAMRVHRRYRFDGIWAMMAHSCAVPAALFKLAHPRVPYLLTLQEGDPPEHIERLARPVWPLFKAGFEKADYLQPISQFLFAWGKRMGFRGRAEVIPNAVDVAKFAKPYAPEEIAAMKASLGKKDGDVYLVTTSRLVHKNAVDDVIRALPLLPESVSFLIYGIGPDEEKLRDLAAELRVSERARFMGQIGHAEMPLMLRACDAFIRPSRSEGMGNSFVEAMAAGLPVIATQEGGIADFLFDEARNPDRETTGWAVSKDAPEEIAAALKDILARPEKVARVRETAARMVAATYDWDRVAGQMRALFEGMLAAGKPV
jgi:glycosyltransferase involved in cell wall biosynthesis